ncbi:MAG: hypothetical protein JXM69_09350 [Anaerolineae bacterium]|nr:hypothetical protein [Anaerolineae bacterium]
MWAWSDLTTWLNTNIKWWVYGLAGVLFLAGLIVSWLQEKKEHQLYTGENILLQWIEAPLLSWQEDLLVMLHNHLFVFTFCLHGWLMLFAAQLLISTQGIEHAGPIIATSLTALIVFFCGMCVGEPLAYNLIRRHSVTIVPMGVYRGQKFYSWKDYGHYQADTPNGIIRLYSARVSHVARDAWHPPERHLFDQAISHLNQHLPNYPPLQSPWYAYRSGFAALLVLSTVPLMIAALVVYHLGYWWQWIYYLVSWIVFMALWFPINQFFLGSQKTATSKTMVVATSSPATVEAPPLPAPTDPVLTNKPRRRIGAPERLWRIFLFVVIILPWALSYIAPDSGEEWGDIIENVTDILLFMSMFVGMFGAFNFLKNKPLRKMDKLLNRGEYEPALEILEKHRSKMEEREYLEKRASILHLKGDFFAAQETLAAYLLLVNTPSRILWLQKIYNYLDLTKSIRIKIYRHLGRIYLDEGRYHQAQAALEYVQYLQPQNLLAKTMLVHSRIEMGDSKAMKEAETLWQQAGPIQPEKHYFFLVSGWALAQQGEYEKGLARLEQGLSLLKPENHPGLAEFHYYVGRIYQKMDNKAKAFDAFARVKDLDPNGRWVKQ